MPRLRVGATEYLGLAVRTRYWMPGDDFVEIIAGAIKDLVRDGDLVVLSEKAISVAMANIVDESSIKPGMLARLISSWWMTHVWGYVLGWICHLKPETISRLRNYPRIEGARHKELALREVGFLQSLRHGSEGGIDGSNVAFSFVSLPLRNPRRIAEKICERVSSLLDRNLGIAVVDTDMTYSFGPIHFTPRPNPMEGILSFGGVLAYGLGRMLKLRPRATPLAVVGWKVTTEEALDIAELAHHSRKDGAGKTVWDMAERFSTGLTSVSWDMLGTVEHFPIVLIKKRVTPKHHKEPI